MSRQPAEDEWRTDDLSWPQHIAEKRKAKQEAESAAHEKTLEEKLDLAVERVHRGTASKARPATIVRSPDPGLRRFFELVASEGATTIFSTGGRSANPDK
jgi:hypothetical protein